MSYFIHYHGKDRVEAHNDYQINVKTEEEVAAILQHLDAQNRVLAELMETVKTLTAKKDETTQELGAPASHTL